MVFCCFLPSQRTTAGEAKMLFGLLNIKLVGMVQLNELVKIKQNKIKYKWREDSFHSVLLDFVKPGKRKLAEKTFHHSISTTATHWTRSSHTAMHNNRTELQKFCCFLDEDVWNQHFNFVSRDQQQPHRFEDASASFSQSFLCQRQTC